MGGRKRKSRKDCDIAKRKLSEGLINDGSCPREVVNGFEADERMSTDCGCARRRLMMSHVRVRGDVQ
jgi:hypothetical protein